ncbi:MAG: Holliday junction branch migration protein RuvA [Pseudomonadota bacterium]
MLAKLAGIIDSFEANAVIVMVGGMGVRVLAPSRTLQTLGQPGDAVQMVTELVVREDSLTLYGFKTATELQWFRLLTSVQGVGPRSGLAILSVCPPDQLQLAIAAQDKSMITQAEGVGPKLAVRIMTELKGKTVLGGATGQNGAGDVSPSVAHTGDEGGAIQDTISALANLGYGRSEAHAAAVNVFAAHPGADASTLIRLALKEMGKARGTGT